MLKRLLLMMTLILVVVVAACQGANQNDQSPTGTSRVGASGDGSGFANPKKSAHYETNTPAHASTLAGAPVNVVIDFNFDLHDKSEISITKDGKDYGLGKTIVDTNKLTLRRAMDPAAPDGLYTVEYNACWPDESCHDGNFQFAIDRSLSGAFDDQRGKPEVTVVLADIKIKPQNIVIDSSTKVTWVNEDAAEHYINTDSHPAHTYYPKQNSRALKKGDTFSLVFDEPGIYPYHCSAHPETMTGTILVEE